MTVAASLLGGLESRNSSQSRHLPGWFNFGALLVALAWFGGTGFILKSVGADSWLSIIIALASGGAGYGLALRFFNRHTLPTSDPSFSDYDLAGTVAKVSSTISPAMPGEIIYHKNGLRRVIVAHSADGATLGLESQVVILRVEQGIAWVAELDRLLTEVGADKWANSST